MGSPSFFLSESSTFTGKQLQPCSYILEKPRKTLQTESDLPSEHQNSWEARTAQREPSGCADYKWASACSTGEAVPPESAWRFASPILPFIPYTLWHPSPNLIFPFCLHWSQERAAMLTDWQVGDRAVPTSYSSQSLAKALLHRNIIH